MAPGGGNAVLADHRYFPEAVLKILAEQSFHGVPGLIPRNNARRLPDLAAGAGEAQIQLVILIADERFIEQTEPLERGLAPTAQVDRIDVTFIGSVVNPGATDGERRT